MTTTTTTTAPSKGKRRTGWMWAAAPVAIFGVQGVVLAITMTLATGAGLEAVEPDYYAQSLSWDAHAEELRRAEKLGWTVGLTVSPPAGPLDQRDVTLTLKDGEGRAIPGAAVTAEAFHHARAGDRTPLTLAPTPAGYGAPMVMRRAGLWEFRVSVRHAGETFRFVRTIEVDG